MFKEQQYIRRKDRALSRKAELVLYLSLEVSLELYLSVIKAIKGSNTDIIDITDYTAITLIATERLINNYFEKEIAKHATLSPKPYKIQMHSCVLTIEPKPAHGHFGNCAIKIGEYSHGFLSLGELSTYDDIYKTLNNLCVENGKFNNFNFNKRALAQMMLEFIGKGPKFFSDTSDTDPTYKVKRINTTYNDDDTFNHTFSITLSDNAKVELVINDNDLNQFMGICYLICIKEATRHMASPEYYKKGQSHYGKELPFSIANFRALKLLEEGIIRLKDVFSKDADYGVSTGENITIFGAEKLKKTKAKFEKINNAFREEFFKNKSSENILGEFNNSAPLRSNLTKNLNGDNEISDQDCWSDDDEAGRPSLS